MPTSRGAAAASEPRYQKIDFTPEDGQAIYKVLFAARCIEGVLFTHDEWDHAMSAFGRLSIVAQAKGKL